MLHILVPLAENSVNVFPKKLSYPKTEVLPKLRTINFFLSSFSIYT